MWKDLDYEVIVAQITLFGPFGASNKSKFYKKVQVEHKSSSLENNFSKLPRFAIPLYTKPLEVGDGRPLTHK
jgi:hypothetical protein